jgi:heterodisulfide reductase subunit C
VKIFEDLQTTAEIALVKNNLTEEIKELGADRLSQCNQCAKCAATCPLVLVGFPLFNKRVIQAILIGAREILLNDISIWACQSCNRCTDLCPQNVNPYEVILATRRMAVREYALPATAVEGIRSLYDVGHAVYLSESGNPRRKLGLPEKPPTTLSFADARREVQAIIRQTVLAELGIIPMGESTKF